MLADFLVWIIGKLPRKLAVYLHLRRLTPGNIRPNWRHTYYVPGDTGGNWRPDYRQQNPSVDPREPNGGESASRGDDHGWSNCTLASGAMVFAYHVHDKTGPWGGDFRHAQSDLEGGTDLYDLKEAWAEYGEELKIKTGAGWDALVDYHNEKRAIVIQGEGNVPGSATFTGGHACMIAPETNNDGEWLWGDPLATGWQWVPKSKIREWAEEWHSGIAFAISKRPDSEPEPEPEPEPPKPTPPAKPIPTLAPIDSVGWQPFSILRANWNVDTWDNAQWYIYPGTFTWAWVDSVPLWDKAKWAGAWE